MTLSDAPNRDFGIAKGEFSCQYEKIIWIAGSHTPNATPIDEDPPAACRDLRAYHIRQVGWACAITDPGGT